MAEAGIDISQQHSKSVWELRDMEFDYVITLCDDAQRAEKVLGGFCGFYGDCGAAVGTGIFISVLTDATPLSRNEWKLSNLMTADSLHTIAHAGGPRCCKRNSFLAILEAARFVKEQFDTQMEMGSSRLKCEFHRLNKECKKAECRFYPVSKG
jgi:hypothetical protein